MHRFTGPSRPSEDPRRVRWCCVSVPGNGAAKCPDCLSALSQARYFRAPWVSSLQGQALVEGKSRSEQLERRVLEIVRAKGALSTPAIHGELKGRHLGLPLACSAAHLCLAAVMKMLW